MTATENKPRLATVPPHSELDEKAVLGCCLLATDCLAEAKRAGISARSFHVVNNQTVFLALEAMQRAGIGIDSTALLSWLIEKKRLSDAGGAAYVAALPDATPSAANIEYHLAVVLEKERERDFNQLCQDGQKAIASGLSWETIAEDFKCRFDSIIEGHAEGESTGEMLKQRAFDPCKEPPPLRAVYSLDGHCIATPGNLATITAAVKAGKSAVIGAMIASTMAQNGNADCLGFSSGNPHGFAVLHCDSEQGPDDHWHGLSRALKRSGRAAPPPWLHSYCLTGLGYRAAMDCVLEAIRQAVELHGGVHSILIDGSADLVADVNDAAETNAFVSHLHGLAIKHDCPIIGVIHFNPGGDKTRGHLGSQMERKAETNLRLDKADAATVIWSDKQRRAPIPKEFGPCFAWNAEQGMHVRVASQSATKDDVERGNLLAVFKDAFSERPAMRYTDLKVTVKKVLTVSDKTAERRIERAATLGIIKVTVAGLYTIKT